MMGLPAFMGNMGVHYVHPELLKITGDTPRVKGEGTHTDFLRPGVLIYEPHYDLHIWLYRENPHGLLSPFNPAVTCEHHISEMKKH